MNKNLKIITVNGFSGMLMVIFIIFGLIAGFVISPAWVCMKLWNMFVVPNIYPVPMNLYQGLLLWAIIAFTLLAINNRKSLIGFSSYSKLTPSQIKKIMKRAKMSEFESLEDLENLQKDLQANTDSIKNDEIKR